MARRTAQWAVIGAGVVALNAQGSSGGPVSRFKDRWRHATGIAGCWHAVSHAGGSELWYHCYTIQRLEGLQPFESSSP